MASTECPPPLTDAQKQTNSRILRKFHTRISIGRIEVKLILKNLEDRIMYCWYFVPIFMGLSALVLASLMANCPDISNADRSILVILFGVMNLIVYGVVAISETHAQSSIKILTMWLPVINRHLANLKQLIDSDKIFNADDLDYTRKLLKTGFQQANHIESRPKLQNLGYEYRKNLFTDMTYPSPTLSS